VTEKGSNKFFILSVMEKDDAGYYKALENSQNVFLIFLEIQKSTLLTIFLTKIILENERRKNFELNLSRILFPGPDLNFF
jgi:hypothetical protein